MRPFLALALALLLAACAPEPPRRLPRPAPTGAASQPYPGAPLPAVAETPYLPGGFLAYPPDAPAIRAESAILIDARTGRVLYAKNPDAPRAAASTQKLLTALVIARSGRVSGPVTIQPEDTHAEPTKLGLRPGETYDRRSLLTAMLVKSCNDVALCLARDHSGSVPAFVAEMNATARSVGMRNSVFANPNGLPGPYQATTARDLAKLAFNAYRDPLIRSIVRLRGYNFQHADGHISPLESTNDLFKKLPTANGMKTGYTQAAGKCLISSDSEMGRDIILIQLGSRAKYIFDDALALHLWALRRPLVAAN